MWREGNPHTVFQENFIYSFIAHAGSLSLQGLFSSQGEQGPLQLWGAGFSLQQFLFLLWSTGSIVVVHGLSCFMACGIFPDQGSNLSPAFASGFFTTEPPRKLQVHCWWDQKLVQPLWKVAQRLLKKLKMQIPYGPAILLLGTYLMKIKILVLKNICLPHAPSPLPCFLQQCLQQPRYGNNLKYPLMYE